MIGTKNKTSGNNIRMLPFITLPIELYTIASSIWFTYGILKLYHPINFKATKTINPKFSKIRTLLVSNNRITLKELKTLCSNLLIINNNNATMVTLK